MQARRDLRRISALLEDVLQAGTSESGALAFSGFAAVNYRRRQRIAAVPFWAPCLVLVLAGRKSVYRGDTETPCTAGEYLALPAPCTLDVVNTPDPLLGRFLAVLIPFDRAVVERFRRLHPIPLPPPAPTPALHVGPQAQLDAAVLHFLDGVSAPQPAKAILEHRLMEVLLCLVTVCDASHMLLSMSPGYAGRLQALLHTDPARNWRLRDVCARLGVSESALRRHLREEHTCFRELLEDLRMGQALAELQLTALPISAIAGRCGYASFSRFSARFRRRFRVSPSQLRRAMTG